MRKDQPASSDSPAPGQCIAMEPDGDSTQIVQTFEVIKLSAVMDRVIYVVTPAHRTGCRQWPPTSAGSARWRRSQPQYRRTDRRRYRASHMARWLLKSEPGSFGYTDLERVRRTGWDGVRNYTARNFLRLMQRGDLAIFYHSNAAPPGAAGICKIVRAAEPDPTQFDPTSKYYDPGSKADDPRWDWVTVAPVRELRFVPLDELRAIPEMSSSLLLAKGNRLSVLPLTDEQYGAIVRTAGRRRRAPRIP